MDKLSDVVEKIQKICKPISIFLYGSRARNDFLENSDFEIGVLMEKEKYIKRSTISKEISEEWFSVYPFKYEDFIKNDIDTPFQKSIYAYELISTGKTLYGEKVIEKMKLPEINIIDIIQDLRFNLGYALASVISQRNKDFKTASMEFYKSCLFWARSLIVLELKKFPLSYDEIYNASKELDLGEYKELIETAYKVRKENGKYQDRDLFQNISFLNKYIEPKLLEFFKNNPTGGIIH